ncbi:MAG: hypothetical protein IPL26_19695 [Leptospiraceae bacterium]|nr:hypothetical protein [Leptospiraceae bacterium]
MRPNPTLDGIVEYSELAPSLKGKGTLVYRVKQVTPTLSGKGSYSEKQFNVKKFGVRLDAGNILELLEEIRSTYGNYVDQDTLNKIISENLNLLDGWSTSQVNRMIEDQNVAMGAGVIGKDGSRPVPTDTKNQIPLIPRKNVVTMANIPRANNTQRLLQNEAYSRYFHDVEEIINNGIIDRLSTDEITKRILDKVDMNAKRARFWAEDQANIFHAEQTRIKAEQAGQTHYRWKCQGNARPSHAVHNNQIYSWKVGVNNLSRPGARHAGEDYLCHCTPEFVTPEEIAKSGVGSPSGRAPQSTAGLVENYTASEGTKAAKGLTDKWAAKSLYNNFSLTEKDALLSWQSGYYSSIVSYLEGEKIVRTPGQIKTLESRIQFIDEAISKSVIPIDLRVMSGVENFGSLSEDLKSVPLGEIIDLTNYTATSLSENIAKSFAKSSKLVLEIILPKGSKGVYMNNVSKLKPHEKEILLPRNTTYKVIDKYEKNGFTYIKLEIKP